ncbi:MAG: hypothetical protein ACLPKW_28385 [Acetobacteraceae bacterium]|jgi:hypothetical protein
MSDSAVRSALWWVCLLLAPLGLIAVELFHPAGFTAHPGMYQFLSQPEAYQAQFQALGYFGPMWWFTLHMIQTPLVALVVVGLWLMLAEVTDTDSGYARAAAWLARAAILVFAIYYTVLDAIGGIGLGRTIMTTEAMAASGQLNPQQLAGVIQLLNTMWTDPLVGGVGSVVSLTGSWAIFIAMLAAALALLLTRRVPWPPLIVLIAFGWELQTSHAAMHGPIAFALLIVASAWLWWVRRRRAPAAPG